ncbi:hypothetical protein Pcinc_030057 [Petrolisthes cinctipes]|uniref:Uncharacterized protein n=1 Tax=Petrolisthes cinctipes TaxID=88211 RepID=A0AAE1EZ24_PETCI|nr:hypothetical protein Pcinc_030057 [Petrolisthes cinctipes]
MAVRIRRVEEVEKTPVSPRPRTAHTTCVVLSLSLQHQGIIKMPSAAAAIPTAAETVIHTVDHGLRTLGYDLKSLVKAFDLQTVGLLTLVVIAGIFLFDLFSYGYSSYAGNTSTYASYGRSLVFNAAKIWDQRDELGVDSSMRGSRNLDSVTQILDSLADAVLKYEKLEHNEVGQTRQAKVLL